MVHVVGRFFKGPGIFSCRRNKSKTSAETCIRPDKTATCYSSEISRVGKETQFCYLIRRSGNEWIDRVRPSFIFTYSFLWPRFEYPGHNRTGLRTHSIARHTDMSPSLYRSKCPICASHSSPSASRRHESRVI